MNATQLYYQRIAQVQANIHKMHADGLLPEQTPEPVLKTIQDPYSGATTTDKVLESVWICSRHGVNISTGFMGGFAVLARPALAASKVVQGTHDVCLLSNPDHIRAISRAQAHQREQAAFHAAADSKRPNRVNVGVIRVPGE